MNYMKLRGETDEAKGENEFCIIAVIISWLGDSIYGMSAFYCHADLHRCSRR